MAEICENEMHEEKHNNELNELMKDMEGWRAALLRLNGVVDWDRPYHPLVLLAPITIIFLLVWYFEPSFLTTVALLGMSISLIDFLVPLLSSMYGPETWTVVQEQQFEQICERIMNVRDHATNVKTTLVGLKVEKPKVYFAVTMGVMAFFAWFGSLVNNLILTYLIVGFVVLYPGLRRHQILEKYIQGVVTLLKRLFFGKPKAKKS
ncbi:ADP-ribosylation factor-like protein 6-interacting protein 1 isoform X1 [Octopus bimaculoides]|uniref:RETREG1-3/ARL6IP-like N-terminal reticulon-homology domain-containing protein n=1 Tax=Octopus bimaculoides TaxID=37653 RepID=A0A0L8GBU3_OCTBM|nr:ADP-ribosylation factor-like protein 6-interacting protein 1 isoform X1 [Octopus bimaculoides]|eukprot:XP_014782507.1 PREDICTED: ADP-ribosylation factor-like protein 6-interacting protein 1 isoform X1 [Octopus bimaculoides]